MNGTINLEQAEKNFEMADQMAQNGSLNGSYTMLTLHMQIMCKFIFKLYLFQIKLNHMDTKKCHITDP